MIKHIIKLIWNQRKSNSWLLGGIVACDGLPVVYCGLFAGLYYVRSVRRSVSTSIIPISLSLTPGKRGPKGI